MKRLNLFLVGSVLMLLLTLAACSPQPGGEPPAEDAATATVEDAPAMTEAAEPATDEPAAPAEMTPTAAPAGANCPTATEDTYVLRNPQHGYCLLYPTTHKVERPNPDEVNLVIGGLLNATDPRANIKVIPAEGRTAATFADEIVAGFEGFEIARSEATVADQPAVVLDDVPGQDINRQVIFAYEDRLYHVYFMPVDPAAPETLDAFAQGILDTFTFIPVSATVTAEDECVQPKADEQQIMNEALGVCFLAPTGFAFEQPSETNANLFFGSMMDVEHPKLMIEVSDAGGMTATQAADALIASFPDMEIQRTFGDMLGYAPADRLDGVPGQDLGRVLLVVHNDRLYRLTFVPADPSQNEVYAQMEELFTQTLKTWRFLP